jgi:hypothetical protein
VKSNLVSLSDVLEDFSAIGDLFLVEKRLKPRPMQMQMQT